VYVRPLLEYASCMWSPYLIKDIERLDDSLNACVFGLQSLESIGERLQFDLIYTYKILTGKIDINISSIFIQSYQSTRGHGK